MRPSEEFSPELLAIEAYVRKRLAKECEKWGAQTRIAKLLGFKVAHVSNIVAGRRRVHEHIARKLCARWGMTYSELEQTALGKSADSKQEHLPNLRATIEWCLDAYPADFLHEYERLARSCTEDRRRRAWLDDIDKQLRIWASGDKICPLGDLQDTVSRAHKPTREAPLRPEPAAANAALPEGEQSITRRKLPRVLKKAG